jgi:pyruvate kinase
VTTKCKRFALSPEIITITTGDTVILDGTLQTSFAAYSEDSTSHPAHIGISYPFILDYVEEQDSIYIDDGKIGLRVIQKHKKTLICKVTHTKGEISAIKPEKGINFPHSHIDVDAITANDYHNLEEIIEYADILGISFAQSSKDIHQLANYLTQNGKENIAITAKIETPKAVERFPEILEALIQR